MRMLQSIFLVLGLTVTTTLQAADIVVETDRNPVSLDETFRLVFSAGESVDDDPDFSPLNIDFEVLGTQQSSQISIINGKQISEKKWIVTLLPKRSGEITIPEITFGSDKSQAGVIQVKQSGDDKEKGREVYVEVEVSDDAIYVQQQLGVTVRVYRSIAVANATLSPLTASGVDTFVESVKADNRYRSRIDGRLYDVFERYYALYPQASGELILNQVIFKATKGMDRFFADPFGQQPKSIIRRSEQKVIEVKPVPATFTGATWLPLHSLKLEVGWPQEPPVFRVGEPVTLTLTLTGHGLPANQLPEVQLQLPEQLKTYPDQPTLKNDTEDNGLVGIREEKIAIIPSQAGKFTLPEIALDYWSVSDEKTKSVSVPAREIQVLPAALQTTDSPAIGLPIEAGISGDEAKNTEQAESVMQSNPGAEQGAQTVLFWQTLAVGVCFAWLITLFLWWRSRQGQASTDDSDNAVPVKTALKQIETACKNNDASACHQALLRWGRANWPESPPLNLNEIETRLDEPVRPLIANLRDQLYSPNASQWDGTRFREAFSRATSGLSSSHKQTATSLQPLFRLN